MAMGGDITGAKGLDADDTDTEDLLPATGQENEESLEM